MFGVLLTYYFFRYGVLENNFFKPKKINMYLICIIISKKMIHESL